MPDYENYVQEAIWVVLAVGTLILGLLFELSDYKTSLTIFCSPILFYLFVHMSPSAEMTMLIVLGEKPDAHTLQFYILNLSLECYYISKYMHIALLNNVQKIYVPI